MSRRRRAAGGSGGRRRATLNVLTFTTLYPNATRPHFGVFVENRLRHLVASGEAAARVVAPVPWFPFAARWLGRFGAMARVPRVETRHGLSIAHPRYVPLPGPAARFAAHAIFRGALPAVRGLIRSGFEFDLIDAHYFYPDGVAAMFLGRALNKPICITGRGNDLNLFPRFPGPRRLILEAAREASGLITVSAALKDRLVDLGVEPDRVTILRNGVDLSLFRPSDRARARARLGLEGPTLLSIGHLIPRKRHDWAIRAASALPGTRLLIAGEGPLDAELRRLVRDLGVGDRVRFLGAVAHEDLPQLYSAVDALILASTSEGWANVLLESMACGTPVLASDVGGAPELVTDPRAGRLWDAGRLETLVEATRLLLASRPDPLHVRAHAERFSWDATTRGQLELFRSIIHAGARRGA